MIKMGCGKNYGISYQPCANYTCGDGCAKANYLVNADSPGYTARFYSQTEHEIFSEFKYNKVDGDYKSNAREIVKSLRGPPIEAYIPRSLVVDDGGSAVPREMAIVPKEKPSKKAIDEINEAQRQVSGQKEIVLREIQIEELLVRRIRAREIVVKKKKG